MAANKRVLLLGSGSVAAPVVQRLCSRGENGRGIHVTVARYVRGGGHVQGHANCTAYCVTDSPLGGRGSGGNLCLCVSLTQPRLQQ